MPAYYSDADGVILSVRRAASGWTVTDDGSTLSGLRTRGAATDAPAFLEAWGSLARPAGDFVPGQRSELIGHLHRHRAGRAAPAPTRR